MDETEAVDNPTEEQAELEAAELERWKKRIDAARQRREQRESKWQLYARLHARAESFIPQETEDATVLLPNGDQVRIGLVHRNIEQTMALLEVPEIGVRATAMDSTRELDASDTHREAVVEQALVDSARKSGLLKGPDESDFVKRDGVIIGHGILYSWYRMETRERETGTVPVVEPEQDAGDGTIRFKPVLDEETGEPKTEKLTETETVYQAVQDEHVPVLEFLFDSTANRIDKSPWHGREQIVNLEELRRDPRYTVPEDLEPSSFKVKNLYGEEPAEGAYHYDQDCVRKVTIWDKCSHKLLTFIECPKRKEPKNFTSPQQMALLQIGAEDWPVTFQHPDDSPFSLFIPIPANDDPFGVSQIEHIRNSAREADSIRTRQANITRQLKRIAFIRKGSVDENQFREALASPDMSLVQIDMPEDTDMRKDIFELPMPAIHPDLYNQQKAAEEDVRSTTGISEMPFGGASTATESENMMAVGGARPSRKRRKFLEFLAAVLGKHRDYLRQWSPPGQTVVVPGDDGMPEAVVYGAEAFAGEFDITVQPGGEATALTPVQQKSLIESSQMLLGKYGPQFDRLLLRQVLVKLDFRDVNKLLAAIPGTPGLIPGLPPGPPPGAPPGVDGRDLEPAFNPNDQTNGQALRAAANAPSEG